MLYGWKFSKIFLVQLTFFVPNTILDTKISHNIPGKLIHSELCNGKVIVSICSASKNFMETVDKFKKYFAGKQLSAKN